MGDNLFQPVAEAGALHAFDISDQAHPCVQWTYATTGAPLRTGGLWLIADGTPVLAFAGQDAVLHVDRRAPAGPVDQGPALYRYR